MLIFRIACGALAVILLCGGCSSKSASVAATGPQPGADLKNPTELTTDTVQQGKVLYHAADCALCDGKEGDGKGKGFDAKDAHMNVHDWRKAE